MRLKEGFVTHDTEGEQVLIATDTKLFSGLVRSNHTAAEIVEYLKSDISKEQIVDNMAKKYEVERTRLENDVERILQTLRHIGALDE